MIKITHLYKSFGDQVVLDDINLDIAKGEVFVVLGESGVGKSVLLKHMIGLIQPTKGSIEIDGQEITTLLEKHLLIIRKEIGYLFQEGALYDFMTVFENLAFPLKEHTVMNPQEIAARVKEILKLVDLKDVDDKYPAELSGGMRKRVGLARAIILNSKIILCDEPTSGLDPIRSRDISDLIRNVSKHLNCTTVITSHDIDNTFRIADRIALIRNGKIQVVGTPEQLRQSNDLFVREFIQ